MPGIDRDIADLAVRFGLIDALRKGLLRSKSHPSQEHPRFAIGASCLLAEIALHSAHEVHMAKVQEWPGYGWRT